MGENCLQFYFDLILTISLCFQFHAILKFCTDQRLKFVFNKGSVLFICVMDVLRVGERGLVRVSQGLDNDIWALKNIRFNI